jgi:hypothetical protein
MKALCISTRNAQSSFHTPYQTRPIEKYISSPWRVGRRQLAARISKAVRERSHCYVILTTDI